MGITKPLIKKKTDTPNTAINAGNDGGIANASTSLGYVVSINGGTLTIEESATLLLKKAVP